MRDLAPYDPAAPIADGRTVIEASAGTGKTYTIAALVTRLVAEEGLALDEILVVTFTRAATAELKARVRGRMRDTMLALDGTRPTDDPDAATKLLLDKPQAEREAMAERLTVALSGFDGAQIFTIHSFAQRLLAHLGFRSRLSPDAEPGEIDKRLLKQVASDVLVARYAHHQGDDEPVKERDLLEIADAVVSRPDAQIVPVDDGDLAIESLARVELAHHIRDMVNNRLHAAGQVSFDDGLIEARDALVDPQVGEAARELLQRRYRIALVDEAQDTDPVQWRIIRSVFDDARMVVVGDPKQSIYSFRGADVESYLAAVTDTDRAETLQVNWRSDGPLIEALDMLFGGATFGDSRIGYREVKPAPGHEQARLTGPGAPLTIHRFGDGVPIRRNQNHTYAVTPARRACANHAAAEIVALLSQGCMIHDGDTTRPLGPADIAVLCRTRMQVEFVREALRDRDVPSVTSRTGGVFTSDAAEEWRRFLLAIEQPDRIDLVRMAATSKLMGIDPAVLAGMSDIEVLDLQYRMLTWRTLLQEEGVPALVGDLHRRAKLAARVLAEPDGERLLTDLTHIAEQMHALWRHGRVASLAAWLEGAMAESEQLEEDRMEEPETLQRRLETDADAVQVQTIHGSKGLEYPVVFVPFAWDSKPRKPWVPVFHDPNAPADESTPRPRLVDVGGRHHPDFATHQNLAEAEGQAEESRLLYVALTRAKHRLHTWLLDDADPTKYSKLYELIHQGKRGLDLLAAQSKGTIAAPILDRPPSDDPYQPRAASAADTDLAVAQLQRELDQAWRRASFTSLSSDHPLTSSDTAEEPLREDEPAHDPDEDDTEQPIPADTTELPMADLPRGARFGTLVHEVIERIPFDEPHLPTVVRAAYDETARPGVWDFDVDQFVAGIVATLETPLGPEADAPALRDIDPTRTFVELSFDLPVRTAGGSVSLADLGNLMLDHLPSDDPYRSFGERLKAMQPQQFRGFLAGAIDLTAELQSAVGPRYVVMDYKSNTMPSAGEVPTAGDYGPAALHDAMISANYVLQALFYQVALHRYLQLRLPGYDPDTHLGGSMYLFVRGMIGPDTPVVDGERCGVARWTPPPSFIVAVSDLFKRDRP